MISASLKVAARIVEAGSAAIALVLLSPLLIVVALAVRVMMGSPIMFGQVRAGVHGRPFVLWKFRTMRLECSADGKPLPDTDRLTRCGKVLRAMSLDELPSLFNVIRGEMALVGPRPLLVEYLARYSTRQATRHLVRPGVTGWAQVNGRNALTWEQRLELDAWYVEHRSLLLDCRILLLTLVRVVRREGINHPGQATMEEFHGNAG